MIELSVVEIACAEFVPTRRVDSIVAKMTMSIVIAAVRVGVATGMVS